MQFIIEYNGQSWTRNLNIGETKLICFPDGVCYQVTIRSIGAKQYKIIAPVALIEAQKVMTGAQQRTFPIHVKLVDVISLK